MACHGKERQGITLQGMPWHGKAWNYMERKQNVRHGMERQGNARDDIAWHAKERHGTTCNGKPR